LIGGTAVLALCATAAAGTAGYRARRAELAKSAPDGVIVVFGQPDRESDDLRNGFYQDPNFYYLTGWKQPGAILLIDTSHEILFLPKHNPDREKWTGTRAAAGDSEIGSLTGFETVLAADRFESELRTSLEQHSRIYTVGEPAVARLSALAPVRDVVDAERTLARMRMIKSREEVELLQHAAEVTAAAHQAAWRRAAPGVYEYQVAAAFTSLYLDRGCERGAYPPIVGSGPNSVYLHYQRNQRRMDRGDLLLIDAGAECAGYAADVTRTLPIGGRFTKRQREIYDIVLGAQKAAIAAVKPGMAIGTRAPNSLYQVAYEYINSHGKDLHGDPLGKYFTHGVSHHIGLEVHDVSDAAMPLAEGMVISVEPGIYIPEEQIGIRIEDMVLVTKDGSRVLTESLPREAAELERVLAP
jgi:Xaa-Pro aminopeptidase